MADPSRRSGQPLPGGTVTLLFTDIEGSTRLIQRLGDRYATVLDEHRRLLRAAVQPRGGHEVGTQGDAFFFAFPRAVDAAEAAVAAQRALAGHGWPDGGALGVRMGLHTGEPTLAGGDYVGLDVHRAARLCAAGHGGQILLSQATRELVAQGLPDGVGLRDLGEHRLKDLRLPERVIQLVAADLPTDFPPLRSLDTVPNNLPRQLTSFVGREREMAEVSRLLDRTALLTLTGAGGAGKTRLALQVAADLADGYPDGVWLVELAALSDPTLVPGAVALALRLPDDPRRPSSETLADHLRPRELLLVLDNCEHLVAACAALADSLLRACPRLRIMATSRESLGIAGEVTWRVPSMSVPDPRLLPPPDRLPQYEAVRLFVERALAAQPSFRLTDQNAPAVVQICHRLDGIPLAIELAAARMRALGVEQIADRLDHRFRLLTGGSRTALPRQQTLRALVDWSHDLLSEPERLLLGRLAVFAGGWTIEAAEAICAGDGTRALRGIEEYEVLDLLAGLVDKSLVVAEEQGGAARYRLLETIRQYAGEKLAEAGEDAAVRRRHRDWFLALAEQGAIELRNPRQAIWLERLETEHDNIRAALEWSAAADDIEPALRACALLGERFWNIRGHHREARARLARLLARAPGRTATRAGALRAAGYVALRQGDYAAALPLLEESLALARELGDRSITAGTLVSLGEALHGQGELGRATALLEESLTVAREAGDSQRIASALYRLADIAYNAGDYARAAARYEESLTASREQGDQHAIAYALRGLGHLARTRGEHERATALLEESLVLLVALKDRRCAPLCVEGLACVASGLGRADRAARLFGAAEALREAIGVTLLPAEQADHDRAVAAARVILDEMGFAAAWAAGRTMSLEQAAEYALTPEEPVAAGPPADGPVASEASVLTAREREVAALIARGLTNSQIAEELVLSVRTVERHVENIYGKVGAHGKAARAAVAAFALRHGLAGSE